MLHEIAVNDLMFLIKGLVIGFVVSIPMGPSSLLFLRRTLYYGRSAGFSSALGIVVGDGFYGVIATLGLGHYADFLTAGYSPLKGGVGIFLILLGVYYLFKKQPFTYRVPKNDGNLHFFFSTLFLTLLNPLVLILFAALFTALGLESFQRYLDSIFFIALGIIAGAFLWWLLLIFLVEVLFPERRDAPGFFNRFSGLLFLIFGLYTSWTNFRIFFKISP